VQLCSQVQSRWQPPQEEKGQHRPKLLVFSYIELSFKTSKFIKDYNSKEEIEGEPKCLEAVFNFEDWRKTKTERTAS
jgi:hypothetical protein